MRSKSSIVKVRITTERIRHACVKSGAAQIIIYVSILVAALQGIARSAALELYETGAPDLGTASAGRAAMAADASTAAANPAGMTLLDRTQLLGAAGALLPSTNFDVAPQTTTKGSSGGMPGSSYLWGRSFLSTSSPTGYGSAWRTIQITVWPETTAVRGSDATTQPRRRSSVARSLHQSLIE
jgi:long-subunit fatty acid transport protein